MPQLSGQKQKELVQLLVEHLNEPGQLDRALVHAGLGNLSNYSQKGTLGAMASELVQALSAQHRIVTFVEAVLDSDFLQGHCPPIEAWLKSNREESPDTIVPPNLPPSLAVGMRWALVPICAVAVIAVLLSYAFGSRPPIGPLQGELIDLTSAAPLTTYYQSHPTRAARDLIDTIAEKADAGAFGSVYFCNPLETDIRNPKVEVNIFEGNHRLDDPDGTVEIHWLPPDQDKEKVGRLGPRQHLTEEVIGDTHDGLVPANTVVVVVYQCKEPRPFPLTFQVWVK